MTPIVTVKGRECISNAPLREAYERKAEPEEIVLARLGWKRSDGSRLQRALGRMDESDGTGKRRSHVRVELAIAIAEALNLDPVDIGL